MTRSQLVTPARMGLEYPMSFGVHGRYTEAQHDVDSLADQGFPVNSVEIVGTELRSVERVTGRLTRGKVAAAGALSGLWMSFFVGIVFSLFATATSWVVSSWRPCWWWCSGWCGASSATASRRAAAAATSRR